MPDHRVVLLDWDNTLHDSAGTNLQALREVLEGYGLTVSPGTYRHVYTVDYRRMYRALGMPEDRIEEASARWRALVAAAEPRLLPGIVEALDALRDGGSVLGLVTSAPRAVVEPQLRRLDLASRFALLLFGDNQPPRPHPAPLRQALHELDAGPQEAAFCSDTAADMRMGQAARVHAVGISSFAFTATELCGAGAVETASSIAAWVAGDGAPCPPRAVAGG